jgi:hypothetical protein
VAPEGCECLKVLPHIPYLDEGNPLSWDDYAAFKEVVLDKMERMGLTRLRQHIVFEHFWTPLDITEQYYSNKGPNYGAAADRWKHLGFKAPKQSERYENLFFVGGSVNPGGGMPMVVLCGQNVAKKGRELGPQLGMTSRETISVAGRLIAGRAGVCRWFNEEVQFLTSSPRRASPRALLPPSRTGGRGRPRWARHTLPASIAPAPETPPVSDTP